MQDFKGVYLGFAPTDESAVVSGEMEVTIDDERIISRHATGLRIQEEEILVSEFEPMTPEEVRDQYNEGEEGAECSSGAAGFKNKSEYYPLFLFTKDPQEGDLGLLIRMGGMIEEVFGPIILFSPTQVARGEYEKAIEAIEVDAGRGVLPRLRNEGKAERSDGDGYEELYKEGAELPDIEGRDQLIKLWTELLDGVANSFSGQPVDWSTLFDAINRLAHRSNTLYGWKHNTDYPRSNGYVEKEIGGFLVQVFMRPPLNAQDQWCAVPTMSS